MKIFGVTGWKNSGKTGLMERLVSEFTERGLSISTIKHAHHDADVDHEGTDSFRHRAAGAGQVVLSSPQRWAIMTELRGTPEPSLSDILKRMDPVNLVLIEGYKSAPHPKIEALRAETGKEPLALRNSSIVALACTAPIDVDCPQLDLNDTAAIADFIMAYVDLSIGETPR